MAGGFWWLLFLSLVITSTSIAAGILPLALSLSRKRVQAISSFGMGLLVGTSLIVIIPEGVSTLYSAYTTEQPTPDAGPLRHRDNDAPGVSEPEHHHHEASPERYVGLALVLGFVFMYFIQILSTWTSRINERQYSTISVNTLRSFATSEPVESSPPSTASFATTLGLLIHATADGIALGASANASKPSLGLIVFFAIMLHKAPAAFGLVAILLKQGLSKRQARGHLVAFSVAAPIGAFATWLAIALLGRKTNDAALQHQHTEWWTGILLLFSAGTFLFVAMHAMQEIDGGESHHSTGMNGHDNRMHELDMDTDGDENKAQNALLTMVGMLAPLVTYLGPHHAH
ncbi:Zinc transporter [Drechslerella dactyloides]|uniref:Zinc transporter n=1 Tax=Drechslerella dactyloides TaxID=74499 RepID=A0AAD6J6Q5_DREDA|nr:Zinc transporter [Drechslerella dactyloides]